MKYSLRSLMIVVTLLISRASACNAEEHRVNRDVTARGEKYARAIQLVSDEVEIIVCFPASAIGGEVDEDGRKRLVAFEMVVAGQTLASILPSGADTRGAVKTESAHPDFLGHVDSFVCALSRRKEVKGEEKPSSMWNGYVIANLKTGRSVRDTFDPKHTVKEVDGKPGIFRTPEIGPNQQQILSAILDDHAAVIGSSLSTIDDVVRRSKVKLADVDRRNKMASLLNACKLAECIAAKKGKAHVPGVRLGSPSVLAVAKTDEVTFEFEFADKDSLRAMIARDVSPGDVLLKDEVLKLGVVSYGDAMTARVTEENKVLCEFRLGSERGVDSAVASFASVFGISVSQR